MANDMVTLVSTCWENRLNPQALTTERTEMLSQPLFQSRIEGKSF